MKGTIMDYDFPYTVCFPDLPDFPGLVGHASWQDALWNTPSIPEYNCVKF